MLPPWQAGLLARDIRPGVFPVFNTSDFCWPVEPEISWLKSQIRKFTYSGASAADFHRLP
jgi:hypothetical protein